MIGNAYLYDNKSNCDEKAIAEFILAVRILINHLSVVLQYDVDTIELPAQDHHKVDRFGYLPKPLDTGQVLEIKEVLACLLDRIEDTYDQIGERARLEEEKKKMVELANTSFRPVEEGTKVINLGVFGNRKRVPPVIVEK